MPQKRGVSNKITKTKEDKALGIEAPDSDRIQEMSDVPIELRGVQKSSLTKSHGRHGQETSSKSKQYKVYSQSGEKLGPLPSPPNH